MVRTGTIFGGTWGKKIRGRFRTISAHAEQERSKLRRIGTTSGIQNSTTVFTSTGEVQTNAAGYVHDLELFWTVQILEDTPAVLSLGKLCEEHGYSFELSSGQKPQLTKNGMIILCSTENIVSYFVPGLSTGSSSSSARLSSTLLAQAMSGEISPSTAIQRSDDTHARASRNRGDPIRTKNKNKNKDNNQASSNRMRDLPEWLVECTENLEHTEVPASRGYTRKHVSSESETIKVVSRKHSICNHFPKYRNCEIWKRTKIRVLLAGSGLAKQCFSTKVRWLDNSRSQSS